MRLMIRAPIGNRLYRGLAVRFVRLCPQFFRLLGLQGKRLAQCLDAKSLRSMMVSMKATTHSGSTALSRLHNPLSLNATGIRVTWFLGITLAWAVVAPSTAAQAPSLRFVEPTNNAVYSAMDEIPIVLRASASNDVFLTANIFANQGKIGTASYCCSLCPCFHPIDGQETTLQIPAPWQDGQPPSQPWQGWTNVQPGTYRLTAHAVGEHGTTVDAAPVNVIVVDRKLHMFLREDGSVTLSITFGSMVPGRYDLEASADLRTWTRLGEFSPGNVAAFYWDVPPENARQRRLYRAVYVRQ